MSTCDTGFRTRTMTLQKNILATVDGRTNHDNVHHTWMIPVINGISETHITHTLK